MSDARMNEGTTYLQLESTGYRQLEGVPSTGPASVVASTASTSALDINSVTKPAGGTTGDYYVVWVQAGDYVDTPPTVTISGFTGDPAGMRGVTNEHLQFFWKAYDGAEGSTFTWAGTSGHWAGGICWIVRGLPAGWTPTLPAPVGVTTLSTITLPSKSAPADTLLLVGYKDYNQGGPASTTGTLTLDVNVSSHSGYHDYASTAATLGPYTLTPSGGPINVAAQLFSKTVT